MGYSLLHNKDTSSLNLSFWQSDLWRDILIHSLQAKEVFYFWDENHFILVEIRSLAFWKYGAFSLWIDEKQIPKRKESFFEALMNFLAKKWCIFYHFEWHYDEIFFTWEPYKHVIMPFTQILSLHKSEAEILSSMHEKCRYNIRLSEKRWVTISRALQTEENIDTWMKLLRETTERDSFASNGRKYYQIFLEEISKKGNGEMLFAYFEWKVIAAVIIVYTTSKAIYYYGASSSKKEDRKQMAPYLLQWHAILEAKKRHIPLYDFLGVADPENPNDPLRSVTEFKEKFGWETLEVSFSHTVGLSFFGKWYIFLKRCKNFFLRFPSFRV